MEIKYYDFRKISHQKQLMQPTSDQNVLYESACELFEEAWTGVDELYRFFTTNRGAGPRAILTDLSQIQNGDIIQLQFTDKDRFDHSPVVVDAGNRTPQSILVAAHSYDADCS